MQKKNDLTVKAKKKGMAVFVISVLFFFAGFSEECYSQRREPEKEGQKFPFEVTSEMKASDMVTQVVGGESPDTAEARQKDSIEMGKSYVVPRYRTLSEADRALSERGMGVLYFIETGESISYESEQEASEDMQKRSLGEPYRIRTKMQKKAASRGYK
jgi:hypothetical protein